MALTKFTANVENISALSDRPNETDGLTSAELKAKFDKAGVDIKTYLNGVLTHELDTSLNSINGKAEEALETASSISENYCTNDDSRLTNSRTCNNTFDNWETSRTNLKIAYGTSLPSSADNGTIFFLY